MHILKQSELDGMPCPDTLIHGECLESMKHIADGSISMILADLPYGTTNLKWDSVIPLEPLWEAYKRVIKPGGAIVLTASQPFTSALVMSNPKWFKYELIWNKVLPTGFAIAKHQPMKQHESVLLFGLGKITYNPQSTKRDNPRTYNRTQSGYSGSENLKSHDGATRTLTHYSPRSILNFSNANNKGKSHPTQKPVSLFEYLIKTYSNPGDLVLDNTMGSATLPVACLNTGRRFIGIELDDEYFAAGCDRVRAREIEIALALPL